MSEKCIRCGNAGRVGQYAETPRKEGGVKNAVGIALLVLRKRAGFGQRDIADWCGVAEPTVSKWETGRVALPEDQLTLLLKVLDVEREEFDWLVGYLEKRNKYSPFQLEAAPFELDPGFHLTMVDDKGTHLLRLEGEE